jgi:hypothetical protein
MGIRDPLGIGRTDPLGANTLTQWVILHGDDRCAFRAGKAKINTFAFCTDFKQT